MTKSNIIRECFDSLNFVKMILINFHLELSLNFKLSLELWSEVEHCAHHPKVNG
jgi:hypothetical protein